MAELEVFWDTRDLFEARRWTESLLERAKGGTDALRALVLRLHGNFLFLVGEFDDGYRHFQEAHRLYERIGDAWGRALVEPSLALYLQYQGGNPDRARRYCESALVEYRRAGSDKGEMEVCQILAYTEKSEGQYEKALALALQAVRLCEQGGWPSWRNANLQIAGECALRLNRLDEAAAYERQLLRLGLEFGDRGSISSALPDLACIAAARHDAHRAGLLFGALEAESERSPFGQWEIQDRELVARELAAVAGPELERGIAEGKELPLDAAIEIALDENSD
jgi:tetratricopeptide (TPR) repeat protein